MNIICFGQQNWDLTWTEKQQHMTRLARRGHRVLYIDKDPIDEGVGVVDSVRALAPVTTRFGLREVEPRVYVYTHRHSPLLGWRLNERRRPRLLRALMKRLSFEDSVLVAFHPDAAPLADVLQPRAVVYYAVDEMSAFPNMTEEERLHVRRREEELLRRSALAFAISPRLLRRFRQVQPRSFLLPNGVNPKRFAPSRLASLPGHPEIAALPRPRLGLVGQIDERVDQTLLTAVARARPHWQIVLVGRVKHGVDVSALAALSNVHFVEFQPYNRLPNVLREMDVCMVPYHVNELTQSCNPAKVFEYVAAGRPVIATPLDGITVSPEVVAFAATPEEFVREVEAALADPEAGLEQRLAVAAKSHWERRTDVLEQRILEVVEGAPPAPSESARRMDNASQLSPD